MRRAALALVGGAALVSTACLMGPNYKRPDVALPPAYRDQPATGPSFGDEKWFDAFGDPVLQQLVRQALANNFDVRIAAARVLEAQEMAGITRAEEFPTATLNATGTDAYNPKIASVFPAYRAAYGGLNVSVLWNLDFWGRYRRATEAARDQLLASEWARRAAVSSLVAQVAEGYFQLLADDDSVSLAQQTLTARQQALQLTQTLRTYGSASQLDLNEAQELVDTAAADVPQLQSEQIQQENLVATLLGEYAQAVPRGAPLDQQPNPPEVPAGLPAELLERRPDIREAEATLMAANAQIGEARAAMFPSVTLTGDRGVESYALNRLLTGTSQQWSVGGNAAQTIFAAGSLHAAVRYSEAEKQEMLLSYEEAIHTAFEQVSDALIARVKAQEYRNEVAAEAAATHQAAQLSQVLYKNGGASFLQVLTAQTNDFAAQLTLVQAEAAERLALVQLYNALGGGWQ